MATNWLTAGIVGGADLEEIGSKRLIFLATWPVIQLSYPLEFLCEELMPSDWSRHASFLFEKPVKRPARSGGSQPREPRA